jgi:membrane protein YdbS with pleckstrin-like domain
VSAESHDAEGNSPAAWTAVIIMLVAFSIGTIAFWFDIPWVVFASVGLLAVGPIVGLFLARAGYGVNSPRRDTPSDS